MNKASEGDGIPAELFQILKMLLWKCTLNMPANLENSAVATGLEKVSFHANPKECLNYHTIALISHPSNGEGNGKALQYSCLENPIAGGTW